MEIEQTGFSHRTEADAVAEITATCAHPVKLEPGNVYSVRGPNGHELVDLQDAGFTALSGKPPVRAWGTYRFTEHISFCEYIHRYNLGADKTNLFACREKLLVEAVINDHAGGGEQEIEEDWGDHRAILNLQHTQAWKDWSGINKKPMDQVAFAEFIEDHLADIVDPSGAQMLEIAQTLEASVGGKFSSGVRLQTGSIKLMYHQDVSTKAGNGGELQVPAGITLGIQLFEGMEHYKVPCRFRTRLNGGDLKLMVIIDQPDRLLRTAFNDVVKAIEESTILTVFHGTAAGAR